MRFILFTSTLLLFATSPLLSQKSNSVQYHAQYPRHKLDLPGGKSVVDLCNLIPGEVYSVIANPAQAEATNTFSIALKHSEQEIQTDVFTPNVKYFTAKYPCEQLEVWNSGSEASPMFISLNQKQESNTEWVKNFTQNSADALGIDVKTESNSSVLVKNVLIGGDCFDVANVTNYGDPSSRGTFSSGTSSINIEKGIVLCTGDINYLKGPNKNDNTTGGFKSVADVNDVDLRKLTTSVLFDVSKIEFDFTPTSNMVQFEFVFGSEEYCDYVGTLYNDVFGFFISGPGITGTKNLALVPNTNQAVTINNINHKTNSNYYVSNSSLKCGGLTALVPNEIELDGFTKILTATVAVEPCKTYHIKLAIADVNDFNYASAVFLKANSFNAGGQVDAEVVYPTNLQSAYEDCGQQYIRFKRGTGDLNLDLPVNYNLTAQSTATAGLDYQTLPTNITIPAGKTEVLVPINILSDGIMEGTEQIVFNITNSCSCKESTVAFLIKDKTALTAQMQDKSACGLSNVTIAPSLSGGVEPITYLWSTNATSAALALSNISGSTLYTVTVTDGCGTTQAVSAWVKSSPIPTAQLSGTGRLCNGKGSVDLKVDFSGNAPWELTWKPSGGASQTQVFNTSPAIIKATNAGVYALVNVETQNGCTGTASGTGTVADIVFNLTPQMQNPLCFESLTGSAGLSIAGGGIPYQFKWSNGANTQSINNLAKGVYTVTVTESNGCTNTQTVELTDPPKLTATASVLNNINCKIAKGRCEVAAQGGTPTYSYVWSNGQNVPESEFDKGGNYWVTITDLNKCSTTATVQVKEDKTPPDVELRSLGDLTCGAKETELDGTGSSTGPKFEFTWSGNAFSCCENTMYPKVNQAGTYNLLVTNTENGCTASKSVKVEENKNYPTELIYGNIPPNCTNTEATIRILDVKGGSSPYLYAVNGDALSQQNTYKQLRDGQHVVLVQDANGCELRDTVFFKKIIKPEIDLQPELNIEYGETVSIRALLNQPLSQIDTIIWSPTELILLRKSMDEIEVQPFKTTEFIAIVTNEDGCTDKATTKVKVGQPLIWAPNVFSPIDKNGINDYFTLASNSSSVEKIAVMQVFNRWGELVFKREGFSLDREEMGWDGSMNGRALQPGVFTWWADIVLKSGEHIEMRGDVAIAK